MPVVRAHLWVSGRVQGVGFRYFVERQAAPAGLAGFVRNLPDRRVEVVAEGPRDSVERLIDAVRDGPPGATVAGVDLVWETPTGEMGFVIRTGGFIDD
jgi:acylphosphatase